MLDYKDIIVKHFGLGMSGRQRAWRQQVGRQ